MTVAQRIENIRERMEKAACRSGRNPNEIRLMGVSKFQGAGKIEEAINAGLLLFGENKVQEAEEKFPSLKKNHSGLELHMIGSLQRNKAKRALAVFDAVESLDRDELITALRAGVKSETADKPLTVLMELHTGEESKSGYPDLDSLTRGAELVLSFPGLRLAGLMTMAPFTQDEAPLRKSFKALFNARETLRKRFPLPDLFCLSMGMSNDFETAIEEGSTLIRIGTAIFGDRVQ
ncbi:MAG: YggS family pyridoxal phosphate-dependent enzyme [Spirochaetaceae bacterium]|jgi:pyridoxal phosphate enzyme (YggS family)|nr:YggS family pyridoxal phosphate-dependent enzyme [Spirochaetaceae bacterium]